MPDYVDYDLICILSESLSLKSMSRTKIFYHDHLKPAPCIAWLRYDYPHTPNILSKLAQASEFTTLISCAETL